MVHAGEWLVACGQWLRGWLVGWWEWLVGGHGWEWCCLWLGMALFDAEKWWLEVLTINHNGLGEPCLT